MPTPPPLRSGDSSPRAARETKGHRPVIIPHQGIEGAEAWHAQNAAEPTIPSITAHVEPRNPTHARLVLVDGLRLVPRSLRSARTSLHRNHVLIKLLARRDHRSPLLWCTVNNLGIVVGLGTGHSLKCQNVRRILGVSR